MFKIFLLSFFLLLDSNAIDFTIIDITSNSAFNHFASLQLWLLIISSPMYLVIGLLRYIQKKL